MQEEFIPLKNEDQQKNPIVPYLSNEYKSISKMFSDKSSLKQSNYFDLKSDDLTKTDIVELEIVPNDIMSSTENPRLKSLYEKESIVRNIIANSSDDQFKARIIAIYDCAVVDVAESVISNQPEKTSCYDDLNALTFSVATPTQPVSGTDAKQSQTCEPIDSQIVAKSMVIEQLKPYTEQVNKSFFVIEFEPSSYTADISYYEKFKAVSDILNKYQKPYKITIIGYQLYDESPTRDLKTRKGKVVKIKRRPKAIKAAQEVNKILKTRALTVRKMLVTNGIPDDNIVIAHPSEDKVKYLYNVKSDRETKNILENIVIVDVKVES